MTILIERGCLWTSIWGEVRSFQSRIVRDMKALCNRIGQRNAIEAYFNKKPRVLNGICPAGRNKVANKNKTRKIYKHGETRK